MSSRAAELVTPSSLARSLHVQQGLARAFLLRVQSDTLLRHVLRRPFVQATEAEQREIHRRVAALYATDWGHVEQGTYPASIARFSWRRFAAAMPDMARDLPGLLRRTRHDVFDDVPQDVRLPAYYRRNFHYQHKGWLSSRSARMYEAQVELLFTGTADAMRRQVLPPVVTALANVDTPRVLDVACGTGGMLAMLAQTIPRAALYGLDLSPHYLTLARQRLAAYLPVSLVAEPAEAMPFSDGAFDAAICVYLMHELPSDVRSKVLSEVARVLKPGATLVLADSVQASEAPQLARFLENFPRQFHEPYFKGYQRDDLEARLRKAGLELVDRQQHFLTAVLVARRT